jgi:hypothetical protein
MPRQKVNVCVDNWHGVKGLEFTFQNNNNNICTVSSIPGQTWPFVQASPISVPARQPGGPGEADCQLVANLADGNYPYSVDGCPASVRAGISKSVTVP